MINRIKDYLEKNEWKYSNPSDNHLRMAINMGNVIGSLDVFIVVEETNYRVYTILNGKAEQDKLTCVGEYINRVNYGLKNGNFEMDHEDGEVRYKVFVHFDNTDIPDDYIEESIILGARMFKVYGKGLLKVLLEEDPTVKSIVEGLRS